jgi:hypothetical protein
MTIHTPIKPTTSITTTIDIDTSINDDSNQNYFSTIRKAELVPVFKQEDIAEYKEKSEILSTYFEKATLKEFLRILFPEGTLQKKGDYDEKKPNAIIMANSNQYYAKKERYTKKAYIIFDELENIECFEDAEDAVIVPASFIGRKRLNINVSKVNAMTFDIDGVTPKHLRTLLYQIEQNIIPKPTFISNSGHGLHLYYVFKFPVSGKTQNLRELTEFKNALTDVLWTKFTSKDPNTQYQGITQGFRLPGSATKYGKGYNAEVYYTGNVITLHELMAHLRFQAETIKFMALEPVLQLEEKAGPKDYQVYNSEKKKLDFHSKEEKIRRIRTNYDVSHLETVSRMSLKEAKEKYPV